MDWLPHWVVQYWWAEILITLLLILLFWKRRHDRIKIALEKRGKLHKAITRILDKVK